MPHNVVKPAPERIIRNYSIMDTSLLQEDMWVEKYNGKFTLLSSSMMPVTSMRRQGVTQQWTEVYPSEMNTLKALNLFARGFPTRRVRLHLDTDGPRKKSTCFVKNLWVRCEYEYP